MTHDYDTDSELQDIAARLEAERAVPHPAFRGDLKRRLLPHGEPHVAPPGLLRLITAYAGTGSVLIAIAALGLAGLGPFAP
jgi:hypothetical protein